MSIDFYGADTPNGHKIGIMLEELGVDYTYRYINIGKNVQKQDWFLKINPNGRIPAIIDHSNDDFAVFESGAILWYLAEKYNRFIPIDPKMKSQVLQWVMFQMAGIGPMFGQAYFFTNSSEKIPFAINRYVTESKRLLGVLESHLKDNKYLVGTEPTIADFSAFPWVRAAARIGIPLADEFPATARWVALLESRPGVKRGLGVTAPPKLDGSILVLGASGNNGERVAKGLLDRKQKVVVGLRNTTSAIAEEFKKLGAEVRAFDFDKKETHADAFKEIHSVFFLPPFVEDSVSGAKAAVDAAKKAGVKFILNFSAMGADSKSTQHLPREHGIIDDYIAESKIAYTHLLPTFFTTNYAWQAQSIKESGAFYGASGTGKATIIHPEDLAEIAITILLCSAKHHGKSYLCTNNESLSGEDIAATLSSVLGKEVKYVDLAPDVQKEALIKQGQPAWAADDLVWLELGKRGGVVATPFDDAKKVLGKPLRTFRQWVEENRFLFEEPKYLVMGATGNTGGRVARKLLEKKARVAVAVRSTSSAGSEELKKLGAELRVFDFSKKETYAPTFAGIHSVYFLPPVLEDTVTPAKAAIDAAKAAGVKFVVSISGLGADSKSSVHLVREHGIIDEYVAASGIGYATLLPTFFTSNLLNLAGAIKSGILPDATGGAKQTVIHPDDIADVSVTILLDSSKHKNKSYVLTNKELVDNKTVAASLSEVLGKEIKAVDITIDAFAESLKKAGRPQYLIDDLVYLVKIRKEGLMASPSDDVEKIIGKTRTYRQWMEENQAAFK